jgi:beta-phosphoglucomutase-like phosphatase (HAD superfamily)
LKGHDFSRAVSGGNINAALAAEGRFFRDFEFCHRLLDYKNGKPSPDAFLFSAGRLGLAPRVCLVFDDTDLGIEAATAAGRASLRVPFPQKETEEPTHFVRL